MADEAKGRGRRTPNAIEAAREHLGTAGENNGESGDNAAPGIGDKTGEFVRQSYRLDEMQHTAFHDAVESDRSADAGDVEVSAFWRAAADRMGFNATTVIADDDFAETGGFTAYPADNLIPSGTADLPAQHETAIERMEARATDAMFDASPALVFEVRDFLLDQIKTRPKPWGQTSQGEQRDIAAACEHASKELVRKVVEAVRADGRSSIRALLESYSEKDGLKASLKIKTFNDEEALMAVVGLHRAVGKHVLITVASADDYSSEQREADTDVDEPGLSFEAGDDRHEEAAD